MTRIESTRDTTPVPVPVHTAEQLICDHSLNGSIYGFYETFERERVVPLVQALIHSHEAIQTLSAPRPMPLEHIRIFHCRFEEMDLMHLVKNLPNMRLKTLWIEGIDGMSTDVLEELIRVLPSLHLESFQFAPKGDVDEWMVQRAYVAAMHGGVKRLAVTLFKTPLAVVRVMNAIRLHGDKVETLDFMLPYVELTYELFEYFLDFVREMKHIQSYMLLDMDYDYLGRRARLDKTMAECGKQVNIGPIPSCI